MFFLLFLGWAQAGTTLYKCYCSLHDDIIVCYRCWCGLELSSYLQSETVSVLSLAHIKLFVCYEADLGSDCTLRSLDFLF